MIVIGITAYSTLVILGVLLYFSGKDAPNAADSPDAPVPGAPAASPDASDTASRSLPRL